MIHHFWGSSPSRRRDGRQRSAGVYPTTLSWRKRKESREQSCAETLPHIHMCLYIHTYTLIYVHIYKYTQLYGYICVHITRTKMSQGASFFCGFFLSRSLSLLPGICLSAAGARPEKHKTQSGVVSSGKEGGGPRIEQRTPRQHGRRHHHQQQQWKKKEAPCGESKKVAYLPDQRAQKGGETHSRVLSPRRRPAQVAAGVSRNAREGKSAAVK